MTKIFTKKTEDFICEHCGTKVTGTGYTNHCPNCLYSKHVDINPGDRQNPCKGLLVPIGIEIKGDNKTIIHKCEVCGEISKCKTSPNDDFDVILELSNNPYVLPDHN